MVAIEPNQAQVKTKPAIIENKPHALHYLPPEMKVFPMKHNIQGGAQQLQEGNDGALS